MWHLEVRRNRVSLTINLIYILKTLYGLHLRTLVVAFIEENSMVQGIFKRLLRIHCPPQLKILNSAASLRLRALTQHPSLRLNGGLWLPKIELFSFKPTNHHQHLKQTLSRSRYFTVFYYYNYLSQLQQVRSMKHLQSSFSLLWSAQDFNQTTASFEYIGITHLLK